MLAAGTIAIHLAYSLLFEYIPIVAIGAAVSSLIAFTLLLQALDLGDFTIEELISHRVFFGTNIALGLYACGSLLAGKDNIFAWYFIEIAFVPYTIYCISNIGYSIIRNGKTTYLLKQYGLWFLFFITVILAYFIMDAAEIARSELRSQY